MTLDEIEKLASETLVRVEEFREGQPHATEIIEWLDARHDTQIARVVMALLPVVRVAIDLYDRAQKCHDRPYMGCVMDHDMIDSAFYDSIDKMRAALEGKS